MRDNSYDVVAFQEVLKYGRASGVELGDCDTAHYAAAFGANGIRVDGMDEFESALKHSLSEPGRYLPNRHTRHHGWAVLVGQCWSSGTIA